MKTETCVVKQ